ncbi:MAG: NAD(P)-binding protein [Caulobacterales bacterium]|nr:NAD(P)-binding protein [Caulobacterales bacterium]
MYEPDGLAADDTRQRLVILGGGMAALTTAFELTSLPDWKERFAGVTIYQMGWRLGGKCASSRGLRDRIQEHGIHAFLGSYHNTLPLMIRCYDELARTCPQKGYGSFEDAFVAQDSGQIWERLGRTASPWPQAFPRNSRKPREARTGHTPFELCITGVFETLLLMGAEQIGEKLTGRDGGWLRRALQKPIERWALTLGRHFAKPGDHPFITGAHRAWRGWGQKLFRRLAGEQDAARRNFITLDHLLTLVFGAYSARVHERGFDRLDRWDFYRWLKRYGAHEETLKSPLNLNHTNITYQYPKGDPATPPRMAAGCYVRWALLSTRYFGSYIWRFSAGSGETLIAPLYEVLKQRGVQFEFFHKVRRLRVEDGRISAIDFDVQADLKDPARGYDPLVTPGGRPSWPAAPRYDQLVQGKAMQAQDRAQRKAYGPLDLESYWSAWRPVRRKTLAAGQHYDQVVFAIAIGAVPVLCKDLIRAEPRWRHMVREIPTYATQHMQIWLKETAEDLGWDIKKPAGDAVITTTYLNPFNQHVEFRDLIGQEGWPQANRPKSLWYFSGPLMDDERAPPFSRFTYPKAQSDRVKYQAIQYLQAAMGQLLPEATPVERIVPGDMFGFEFDLLNCPEEESAAAPRASGLDRFDTQYWRANIDPSERYVGCPRRNTWFRLKPWDSGFANLVVAGDWTYSGLNVGSVEGAVMSGRLACHALTSQPPLADIVGYDTTQPGAKPSAAQLASHAAPPTSRLAQEPA